MHVDGHRVTAVNTTCFYICMTHASECLRVAPIGLGHDALSGLSLELVWLIPSTL